MAVAFDAVTVATTNDVDDPSFSHTPVGTPTLALLSASTDRDGTLDAVTYGGAAMTLVGSVANGTKKVYIWRLLAPAAGAQTVQLTTSASNFKAILAAHTYTGSHASTAPNGFQSSVGSGTATATAAVTTGATGDLVVDTVVVDIDDPITPGASQTERWDQAFVFPSC